MALEGWEMHVFDRLPSHGKTNPTLNYQSYSPSRHCGHADCSMKRTIHPTTTESSFKPSIPSDCLDELLPSSFYCLEEINKGAYVHNAKCPSELPLPDFFSPNWVQPGIDHNISAEEPSSSEQSIDEQQQISQTRKRKSMPKEKSKAATSTIASSYEWNTKSVFQAKRRKFAELTKEKDDSKSEVEQASHGSTDESSPKQAEHNGKPPEARKETYVHVRARRGQATDSHSLAERVRREKISERMKFLQDLVPGCNKITGKAVMLDEIINYVQSLQHQVEFLSMKLEAVNPQLDFNLEGFPAAKDVLGPAGMVFASDICVASDTSVAHSQFHQPEWEPAQVGVSCETGEHVMESTAAAVLRRIMNNLLLCMDGYGDVGSQISNVWDDDLQSVVRMGFGQNVTSQSFHEMFPTSHVKIAP